MAFFLRSKQPNETTSPRGKQRLSFMTISPIPPICRRLLVASRCAHARTGWFLAPRCSAKRRSPPSAECIRSQWIGLGGRVERFEQEFARYKGAPDALAVSSGTAAIHLALAALGIGAGDEVIAPSMTWCSTIHVIVHTGATPVLVDCCRDSFNIDPAQIEVSHYSANQGHPGGAHVRPQL